MTIEAEVANRLVHQERVAAILSKTGGEIIHPDHYEFRMAFRDAALAAMDDCSDVHAVAKVEDRDLPALFKALDALAETLWLRRMGLAK